MANVAVLPIGSIEENAQALRVTVDKESLAYQELKDGIKCVGLLNPISVREFKKEDGTTGFRLVDGLHRLTACTDLGYTEIPVNIVTIEDDDLLVAQIIGNNNIKTTKTQFAQGLKQLIQHKGYTKKEVSRLVCKSEKWIDDMLGLLTLPESVQKLIDEGKIVVRNAISLKSLPADKLEDFLAAAMTESPDIFCPKVEEAAKEFRQAARTGVKAIIEFKPIASLRKPAELKGYVVEADATGGVSDLKNLLDTQGISDPYEAAIATLKFFLHLDPVSVAAQRSKWDAEQKAKDEAKKKREEERAAKKAAEAQKAVAAAV